MDVVVVAPYGANRYHFETDLELAQRHLLDGDRVTLLTCSADLESCDINVSHEPDQCLNCILRRRRALRALEGRPAIRPLVTLDRADLEDLSSVRTSFDDIDDLRAYRFRDFDLGMAVLSTLVSFLRDPEPSVDREAGRIKGLASSTAAVYLAMRRRLRRDPPQRVYAFNGRIAIMRAVLRACQENGIDCHLHDRGSSADRFAVYENALPHAVAVTESKILKAWEEACDSGRRESIAARFYEDRRRGEVRNWYSFTSHQQEALLPDSWDEGRHNVVIFPSSEDEFVAIGTEWRNPLYGSQEEGLHRIVDSLRGLHGLSCHLRIHPNLRNLDYDSLRRVMALDGHNIHIVPPDSEVSSYAMLFASDVVLTFGSTMGIEATYWGKPSVLAGQCFYRGLGSTYNPAHHNELIDLLTTATEAKDPLGALQYGFYFATFGEPFTHFHPDSLMDGEFRGKRIGPGPLGYRLLRLLRAPGGAIPRRILGRLLDLRAPMKRSWGS